MLPPPRLLGKAPSPIRRRRDDGDTDDADDDDDNIGDLDVVDENDESSPPPPPTTTGPPRCWNDDTPLDGDSSNSGNSNDAALARLPRTMPRGNSKGAGRTNTAVEDLILPPCWFVML